MEMVPMAGIELATFALRNINTCCIRGIFKIKLYILLYIFLRSNKSNVQLYQQAFQHIAREHSALGF